MSTFLQRWSYEHLFLGKQTRDFPLTTSAEEVRAKLDNEFGNANWKPDTLKKDAKVKDRTLR